SKIASSPLSKNIPLSISVNQNYNTATSSPRRGVGHRHQALGWDAMDASASGVREHAGRKRRSVRRSRVVLTPLCRHQVRGRPMLPADDGDNKALSPGSNCAEVDL